MTSLSGPPRDFVLKARSTLQAVVGGREKIKNGYLPLSRAVVLVEQMLVS